MPTCGSGSYRVRTTWDGTFVLKFKNDSCCWCWYWFCSVVLRETVHVISSFGHWPHNWPIKLEIAKSSHFDVLGTARMEISRLCACLWLHEWIKNLTRKCGAWAHATSGPPETQVCPNSVNGTEEFAVFGDFLRPCKWATCQRTWTWRATGRVGRLQWGDIGTGGVLHRQGIKWIHGRAYLRARMLTNPCTRTARQDKIVCMCHLLFSYFVSTSMPEARGLEWLPRRIHLEWLINLFNAPGQVYDYAVCKDEDRGCTWLMGKVYKTRSTRLQLFTRNLRRDQKIRMRLR